MTHVQWQPWPENGPGEEYYDLELLVWVPYFWQSYLAAYESPDTGTGWVIHLGNVWRHIYEHGEFELDAPHEITHFAAILPPEDAA